MASVSSGVSSFIVGASGKNRYKCLSTEIKTTTNTIVQPDGWAKAKGYANGVLTEDGLLFVGGQILSLIHI